MTAGIFRAELYAILLAKVFSYNERKLACHCYRFQECFNGNFLQLETSSYYGDSTMVIISKNIWSFVGFPSHIGISSNELVDTDAKAAVHDLPVSNNSHPILDYYTVINSFDKGMT